MPPVLPQRDIRTKRQNKGQEDQIIHNPQFAQEQRGEKKAEKMGKRNKKN